MPLYEYECQQCHRRTEKRQKFSDPEITECPYCGGHLERVISAPAFAFAGGGWYKDLYSTPKPTSDKIPASSSEAKTTPEAKSSGKDSSASATSTSTPAPSADSGNAK